MAIGETVQTTCGEMVEAVKRDYQVNPRIELLQRGLQQILTDKMFRGDVKVERDPKIIGNILNMTWDVISRTFSTERADEVPATFLDYLKVWIPFVRPRKRFMTVNIIHQCPHIVADPAKHLDWVVAGTKDEGGRPNDNR